MKRLLKIISIVIAIPILLFVIAAIVFAFMDLNPHREFIGKQISDATGRQLELKGELSKSFFPWLGVKIGGVEMSNAAGFKESTFAAIELAEVRVDIMSLLKMQPAVDKIVLHGLRVNLARDASGKTNWDDFVTTPSPDTQQVPQSTQTEKPPVQETLPSQALAGFALGGIDVRNAQIQWDDALTNTRYDVKDLNLSVSEVELGKPLQLDLALDFSSTTPGVMSHIEIHSQKVQWNIDTLQFQLLPLNVTVNAKGDVIAGGSVDLTLNAPVDINLQTQQINLSPLKLTINAKDGYLEKSAADVTISSPVNINLAKQIFALSQLDIAINAQGELIPGGKSDIKINSPLNVDLEKQTASLSNLNIKAMNMDIQGKINAEHVIDKPVFTSQLNIAQFNPMQLLKQLGIESPPTADANVLQKAAMSLAIKGDLNNITVNPIDITMDDTHVKGQAGVAQFANPKITFTINVNGIDVDRYLPPPAEGEQSKTPAPVTPVSTASAAAKLPVELLRALNMDGTLKVGSLTASKITTTNLVVGVKANAGNIRLQPFDGEVSQGKFKSDITLDATGDKVKVSLKEDLQSVQVEPLLKALIDNDLLSGAVKLNADISTSGEDVDQLMAGLNGKANFQFQDGAVKGFNLAEYARQGKAKIKGQSYTPSEVPKQTDFTELTGKANIINGIVETLDIEAKAPGFRIIGEGKVNLIEQSINYLTSGYVVATSKGQGGAELDDLKGIPIPVRISGPFTALKFELDYDPMIQAYKEQIKKRLDEKKQEVKTELKEKQQEAKQQLQEQKDEKLEAEKARLKEKEEAEKKRLKEKLKKLF